MASKSYVYRGFEVWLECIGKYSRELIIKKNAKMVKKVKYSADENAGMGPNNQNSIQANTEAMAWIDQQLEKHRIQ